MVGLACLKLNTYVDEGYPYLFNKITKIKLHIIIDICIRDKGHTHILI